MWTSLGFTNRPLHTARHRSELKLLYVSSTEKNKSKQRDMFACYGSGWNSWGQALRWWWFGFSHQTCWVTEPKENPVYKMKKISLYGTWIHTLLPLIFKPKLQTFIEIPKYVALTEKLCVQWSKLQSNTPQNYVLSPLLWYTFIWTDGTLNVLWGRKMHNQEIQESADSKMSK